MVNNVSRGVSGTHTKLPWSTLYKHQSLVAASRVPCIEMNNIFEFKLCIILSSPYTLDFIRCQDNEKQNTTEYSMKRFKAYFENENVGKKSHKIVKNVKFSFQ